MSLVVWLPLNGDFHNQGLDNLSGNWSATGVTDDNNGKIGKCKYFNQQYAQTDYSYTLGSQISCALWVNYTAFPSGNDWLFSLGSTSGYANALLALTTYHGDYLVSVVGGKYETDFQHNFSLNTWYHIAMTWDGAQIKTYINGELKRTYNASSPSITSSTKLTIGANAIGTGLQINAKLNDLRIYDHCLSPKEIEELAKGLVLHYKLDGITNGILPIGYSQLEYIEGSGSSYLNTQIAGSSDLIIRTKYLVTSNGSCIFGYRDGNNLEGINFRLMIYNNLWYLDYGTGSRGNRIYGAGSTAASLNTLYEVEVGNRYIKNLVNNTNIISDSAVSSWSQSALIGIFGSNTWPSGSSYAAGKCYYLSIANTTGLLRYYIPCKQLSDNKIGMYDLITKTFVASATSTAFTAGPIVTTPTTIYDSSGYSHNGTIVGNLTAATGSPRYGTATVFNGSSYITVPFSQQCLVDSFTISAWFYADATNSYRGVGGFHSGRSPAYSGICFGQWNGTAIRCNVGNGSTWESIDAGTTALSNNWHLLTLTYSKNNKLIAYIDGVKTNETTVTVLNPVTTNGFAVGRAYNDTDRNWLGKISDVRCYSIALTATQVKELYTTSMSIDSNGNIYARELSEL